MNINQATLIFSTCILFLIVCLLTQNSLGIIHMFGNVAEMEEEGKIVKGGSWIHKVDESKIKSSISYSTPTSWFGFRCIAEVHIVPRK